MAGYKRTRTLSERQAQYAGIETSEPKREIQTYQNFILMPIGTALKEMRTHKGFTLRQVEEGTGISNAYLSQLETGKITKPSANVLYKIASFYGISIEVVLEAAGFIQRLVPDLPKANASLELQCYLNDLTEQEEKLVIKYIQFLRFNAKHG